MNDDVAFLFCVPENTAFHWLFCGHRHQGPYCMNRDYQCNIGITFDSGTFPYWLYGTTSMLHWILPFARALVLLLLVIFVLSSGEGCVRPVFSSNFFAFRVVEEHFEMFLLMDLVGSVTVCVLRCGSRAIGASLQRLPNRKPATTRRMKT